MIIKCLRYLKLVFDFLSFLYYVWLYHNHIKINCVRHSLIISKNIMDPLDLDSINTSRSCIVKTCKCHTRIYSHLQIFIWFQNRRKWIVISQFVGISFQFVLYIDLARCMLWNKKKICNEIILICIIYVCIHEYEFIVVYIIAFA